MSSRAGPTEASRSGRILLAASIAFSSGIVARGPGGILAVGVGLVIARLAWPAPASRLRPRGRRRGLAHIGTLVVAASLAAGSAVASLHTARDGTRALMESWRRAGFEEGETPVRILGVVTDVERLEDDRVALTLRLRRAAIPAGDQGRAQATPPVGVRITLPWPALQPIPWREGETIETVARLGRPRRFRNPG